MLVLPSVNELNKSEYIHAYKVKSISISNYQKKDRLIENERYVQNFL